MISINSTGNREKRQARLSNMELLRLLAMFLILLTHCTFLSLGVPSATEAHHAPTYSMLVFFFQSVSVGGVNIFVLISGWFGIRFDLVKVGKLLSQAFFYSILVISVLVFIFHQQYQSIELVKNVLMLHPNDYWFVKAYLGLMLLAPMLNLFIEHSEKKNIRLFLVVFFLFQTIYGWIVIDGAQWLEGGYSAYSFIGLYILGRYCRLYVDIGRKRNVFLMLFFLLVLLQAGLAFGVTYIGKPVAGRLFTYTNPVVILQALCLLLYFSQLKFYSSFVNWLAVSSFSIYLLHANELVLRPYYGRYVNLLLRENGHYGIGMLKILLFICTVFFISILIDKIRIFLFSSRFLCLKSKNIS